MSNLKITIPKPCSENWENMKQLEQSRFCDSCEKEVFDFTKFSIQELQDYFKYPKGNICGRINQNQLNNFNQISSLKNNWNYRSARLFVASCLILLTSSKSYSKEVIKEINPYQEYKYPKSPKIVEDKTDTLIAISGIVRSATEDGLPIPRAKVTLKGRFEFGDTDIDGRFKIQIKPSSDQKITLVIQCLGYETRETEISLAQAQDLEIKLTLKPILIGKETIVMAGGLIVKRPITKRVGNFFSRIFTGHY